MLVKNVPDDNWLLLKDPAALRAGVCGDEHVTQDNVNVQIGFRRWNVVATVANAHIFLHIVFLGWPHFFVQIVLFFILFSLDPMPALEWARGGYAHIVKTQGEVVCTL